MLSTSSVYVHTDHTLDNGMGMSAGFSSTRCSWASLSAIDTGMGSVAFGKSHQSAVDGMDSMPAGAKHYFSNSSRCIQ